ncbi:helitron_like_N domain-containing protein [Trichonephila inaurata madagascariensis]|uniref:Helitron_like_N domain-containing protein n=1 Tax=Trichonephila inaurata madagascariensis TaxID=2747483 RepID=A0A8X7BVU4_9ARAC|nr:helitron_like_N domain-containing protein [Trichonephila inaurata madagascariensis]
MVSSDNDKDQGEKSDEIGRKRKLQNKTDESSKTIAKHVPECQNFHTSQIPGPSTGNVSYIPPTHTPNADRPSIRNELYIPISHSDYNANVQTDIPLQVNYVPQLDEPIMVLISSQDDVQDVIIYDEDGDSHISELIPIDERLIAQHQTLMWNDDMYLRIAPGEELFVTVTPFMMATSELRRSDRRGVTPQHLLCLAIQIMRIRIRDSLSIAFKHVGKGTTITKEQIESEDCVQGCIESNLAFLPRSRIQHINGQKEKRTYLQ